MRTLLFTRKFSFLSVLLLFLGFFSAAGQCPVGDVTLTTQAEVDAFAVSYPGCTTISGYLTIGPSTNINNLNALASLTQINQSLTIYDNTNLTDMSGLSGLTSVYRSIVVNNNPLLSDINLEAVSGAIIGDFYVENNATLTTLAAPINLISIGNFAYIRNNPNLADLTGLENLTTIGRGLEISNTLEDVFPDFSSLTSVGAGISIGNNQNVISLNFQNVGGTFYDSFVIQNNPSLTSLAAPITLTAVTNNIYIINNPNLADLTGLESLTTIGRSLIIDGVLEDVFPDFSNLTMAGAGIGIGSCPNVTSLNFQNVGGTFYNSFAIQNNASLTTLAAPAYLTAVADNVYIIGNSNLINFTGLENLTTIGRSLVIANTLEDDFPDFNNLTSVGTAITISDNLNVTSLNFRNVSGSMQLGFGVGTNPALQSLAGPLNLIAVGTDITIIENASLTSITGFENVTSVGRYLWFEKIPASNFPDFSNLTHVGRRIYFVLNPNVMEIKIPNVAGEIGTGYTDGAILIGQNNSLSTLAAPGPLVSVTGSIGISYHPSLTTFTGFGGLTSIGKNFQLYYNNAPAFPAMLNLTTIGKNLEIVGNAQIENLDWLANLVSIGDELGIQNNPLLSNCTISAVCDFLTGTGGRTVIGNTGCCQNEPVLTNACNNVGSGTGEVCDGIDNNCDGQIDEGFDPDQDGYADCFDNCPLASNEDQLDSDEDGVGNACDGCPYDPLKTEPGECGCGQPDPGPGDLPCDWVSPNSSQSCSGEWSYNKDLGVFDGTAVNCFYASPFNYDEVSFAGINLCGDGSITAQVLQVSGTTLGWAGVIMEETNAADAKKVQLMTNMNFYTRREIRYVTGGNAYPQQFPSNARRWLRLVRNGSQFSGYTSLDGINWYYTMSAMIDMNSCIKVGLVITNYHPVSTVEASFTNVTITGNENENLVSAPQESPFTASAPEPFHVFPNPTTGELNLELSSYSGKAIRIEVYSLQGQLLQSTDLQEAPVVEQLDLSTYPSSLYLVRVSSAGQADAVKRVAIRGED